MAEQQPLRILHCFRSPVGGIFRHVRDLVEEHSKAGHEIGILCDSSTGGEYEDSLFDDIRPYLSLGLTRVPIRRSISPSDIATMWDTYKKIKVCGRMCCMGTAPRAVCSRDLPAQRCG